MKRSEMLLHIKEMLLEIEAKKKNVRPNDLKFYDRQAADILDMLLGFGMSPPETLIETENPLVPGDININGKWYTPGRLVWEDEDKPPIS